MSKITAFKNIYEKSNPYPLTIEQALERVRVGKSKEKIEEIRNTKDKDKASVLKNQLPSICFSGEFANRSDDALIKHSGYIVLDFDDVGIDELRDKQTEIISHNFVYACWVSPRGNGLKALVKVADGKKHAEHFDALRELFPEIDKSGRNVSRVCFESYDPDVYVNKKAVAFTKTKRVEKIEQYGQVEESYEKFKRLMTWLTNRNDAFVKGERNLFIFKLASACCRFGIEQDETIHFCNNEFLANDNTFTRSECENAIRSAYKSNKMGTAIFEKDVLVDKVTRGEIVLNADIYNTDIKPKDVIYAEDVREKALNLYHKGYESVDGVFCQELDNHFKLKRGEMTLISGISNYGKSAWMKWYLLLHAIHYGRKFALFPPEDNPTEEFYHDLVEILLGADCTNLNPNKPTEEEYNNAYSFVGKHFFYIFPKEISPTPEYIKERFLELIIKEKVDGCVIDPFNQMTNDYASAGGRDDKYLEAVLGDFDRFAVLNSVYFIIIAHPKTMHKDKNGGYPCPDVFDLSGGAMWNNKMYNILIYHRPNHHTDPHDPVAEIHTKKIKRQKVVGRKGTVDMRYNRMARRFIIDGLDVVASALRTMGINFKKSDEAPF